MKKFSSLRGIELPTTKDKYPGFFWSVDKYHQENRMLQLHLDYIIGHLVVESKLSFGEVIKEGDPKALKRLRYRWNIGKKVYMLISAFPCFFWFSVCFRLLVLHWYSRMLAPILTVTSIDSERSWRKSRVHPRRQTKRYIKLRKFLYCLDSLFW